MIIKKHQALSKLHGSNFKDKQGFTPLIMFAAQNNNGF
jgi:hypothetical protein